MKILKKMKDGGDKSTVTGYWLVEIKSLFSICLLKFDNDSREAYHSHAFNCISWLLKGKLIETFLDGGVVEHNQSFKPFITTREHFHKVDSVGTSWVLTFRGAWVDEWSEYIPESDKFVTLTHGRQIKERV